MFLKNVHLEMERRFDYYEYPLANTLSKSFIWGQTSNLILK